MGSQSPAASPHEDADHRGVDGEEINEEERRAEDPGLDAIAEDEDEGRLGQGEEDEEGDARHPPGRASGPVVVADLGLAIFGGRHRAETLPHGAERHKTSTDAESPQRISVR